MFYFISYDSPCIFHILFSVEGVDEVYPSPGPYDPLLDSSECSPGPGTSIPYAGTPPGKPTAKLNYYIQKLNYFI